MNLFEVLAPTFAYIIPLLFFIYMGMDVLLRNTKSVEHRLVSLTIACYALMFLEEFVRHQLPIEYSPALAALWFANTGILVPGLGFHFLVKISRLDKKMPRYVYPYVFYLPLLVVAVNLISSDRIISVHQFVQSGLWKIPVYNNQYYIALTISLVICVSYLIVLLIGVRRAGSKELKDIHYLIIFGVILVFVWTSVFGYFNFGDTLPPYPYIYAGLVWCFILRLAMIKYDFLNFIDKRYEKLFNLNPTAIFLIDPAGKIKEANPSARKLLKPFPLDSVDFFSLCCPEVKELIGKRAKIKDFECAINHPEKRIDVLLDGDYVLVDSEQHVLLIVRDITLQKDDQKEITFLAYHDPLTRLPNRRYFYEKLDEAIDEAREQNLQLAVILIDLDHFKETNDRYGHKVGDRALQHTASIILEAAASTGMAARLGGDEFVLFINRIPSIQFVESAIQQLLQRFEQDKLMHEDQPLPIQMSIGASIFPDDGMDADTLMNNADKAMYRVKRSGRNAYDLANRNG